jgi:hypothetical protein
VPPWVVTTRGVPSGAMRPAPFLPFSSISWTICSIFESRFVMPFLQLLGQHEGYERSDANR